MIFRLRRNDQGRDLDLDGKQFVALGLPGSGKTTLVKHLLAQERAHLVYDPNREYGGFRAYQPNDIGSLDELDWVIDRYVKPGASGPPHRLFVMDEANIYIPHSGKLRQNILQLAHLRRHWGVGWGVVARRPSNVHTEVREMTNYLFVFRITGLRDRQLLNDWHKGLGDLAAGLKPYHYAVCDGMSDPWVSTPVPLDHAGDFG